MSTEIASSTISYFFIFELEPSKTVLTCVSLKKGTIVSTFTFILIESLFFIIDLFRSEDNIIFLIFRHFLFSLLNFFSFVKFVKSLYQLDYKQAYYGYLAFTICIYLHLFLFIFNLIFGTHITSIYLSSLKSTNYSYHFYNCSLPNIIFILLEIITSWICYSYTKNLSYGKDALVDGQSFDRYFEDLASNSKEKLPNKFASSGKKKEKIESRRSEDGLYSLGLQFFFNKKKNDSDDSESVDNNNNGFPPSNRSMSSIDNRKQEASLTHNEEN